MPYLVVLRFNSATNARQFVNANPGINPQVVNSSLPDGTYVVATPSLLSDMPQGDIFSQPSYSPQYLPIVTYNPQGYIINYQPGLNLNDLTLTTPDGKTIISQGVPSTDVTDLPPPPPPDPDPVPYPKPYNPYNPQNPINPDLPIQPPAQDPNQVPIPKPFNPYNPFNPIEPTLPIDPQLVQLIYPEQTRFVVPPGIDPTSAPDVPLDPLQQYVQPWELTSPPDLMEIPYQPPSEMYIPDPPPFPTPAPELPLINAPEIKVYPGDLPDWMQQPLDLDQPMIIKPDIYYDPRQTTKISYPGQGGGSASQIVGANFLLATVGQQQGPANYYTSIDGVNWTAFIGGMSVTGAPSGDGNAGVGPAGFGNSFVLSYFATGFPPVAGDQTQLQISHNGGQTFALSSMVGWGDGANSPSTGILFNYYDVVPVSGPPGFRLALQNLALTQVTYYSSYDGANSWTVDATLGSPTSAKPAAWGTVPIQSYAKGIYKGQTFYAAAVSGAGGGNIYGGTTKPTPPINSIPAGWTLLFATLNGRISIHMAANVPGNVDTVFVIDDSVVGSPSVCTGTGNPGTWQEKALFGTLQITHGISRDITTWVYS